ncbi:hypothetical protein ACGE24_08785 [Corynebacterium kroppenstedtii]
MLTANPTGLRNLKHSAPTSPAPIDAPLGLSPIAAAALRVLKASDLGSE